MELNGELELGIKLLINLLLIYNYIICIGFKDLNPN